MADNFVTNAGSGGSTFAADDIGSGVLLPRAKVVWGPDGTGNDADDTSGKRLPVKVGEPAVDRTANGTLSAAAQTVEMSTQGCASSVLQITGTFVATVQFEGTVEGTTWFSVDATVIAVGTVVNSATATGQWFIQSSGLSKVRARCSAYTSGSAIVNWEGGAGSGLVFAMKAGTWSVNATLLTSTATTEVVGDAAHNAAVSGNPLLNGFEGRTTDGTPVTSGNVVRGLADSLGKQVVIQGAIHDLQANGTTNYTNNAAADVIAAAGAGVRIAVTSVMVTNAHATQGTKVTIRDGTTSKITGYAAPAGGGFVLQTGGRPLFITTANTAATAICGTSGADVDVSLSGYKIAN